MKRRKTRYNNLKCRVYLVREGLAKREVIITKPADVFNLVKEELGSSDRERFLSIMLSTRNAVIAIETISIGTLNASLVSPREVFKGAILVNACSVVISHNHPSGSTEPSEEDLKITKQLKEAGTLLGIELLDHIIVGHNSFLSLKESTYQIF
jgi:DNA repair protein RadC